MLCSPETDIAANTGKLDCPLKTRSLPLDYPFLADRYFVYLMAVYSASNSAPHLLKDCVVWGPSSGTYYSDHHTKALTGFWILQAAIAVTSPVCICFLGYRMSSLALNEGDIQMPVNSAY